MSLGTAALDGRQGEHFGHHTPLPYLRLVRAQTHNVTRLSYRLLVVMVIMSYARLFTLREYGSMAIIDQRWNSWNRYSFGGAYQWIFPVSLPRGFWVIHTSLTRVRPWRTDVLHMATCGIVNATMLNPPLFEAQPERWRGILGGDGMTQVNIGLDVYNSDVTACFLASRWG